jgi:hypothetical protein
VQEVLVYKYQECAADKSGTWLLASQRSFANPVHSILYLDVTGDGVKEFVILTLRGVHIMQVSSLHLLKEFMIFRDVRISRSNVGHQFLLQPGLPLCNDKMHL